jgi:hypothetical protein
MKKFTTAAAVIAATAFAATADVTDYSEGPIISPYAASFTVDFVSSSAGWTGQLSWLSNTESQTPFLLMSNKSDPNAAPTQVATVGAGEAVLFQYEITRGTHNIFRQDDEVGGNQFRHQWTSDNTARLFVEDIKLPGGDADYNDAVFDVVFTPVPTPGTVAIAGLAGGLLIKRRR